MRIAILDFHLSEAKSICEVLSSVGHECDPLTSSTDLLSLLHDQPYDALVIGLQHPEEQQDLVRAVRKQASAAMPILIITSSTSEDDIIATLDAGANDYMFRPTRRRDLITRVLVLLRRAYPSQIDNEKLEIGPYIFEPRRGRLIAMGKPVDVTRKEFDLALLFLRNLGRPLSRALILETVWAGHSQAISRTMDTHVSRVRNKLNLIPRYSYRLSPVYGYGYRLDEIKPT
ncbi:response regulator transcription factor [Noviherbaspirillum sp. L7-7A]|uniref:response regulator transcription factor n=1 Tax=Noviherbaspirillum sp. L7-7A TaxID=2850560 RepID=UPI001C2C375C|nr:response regulator transcription factor [Noviherbaspirillum sp. L7-7A]MBV0881469.1 response regulator transcription factor [Noviherbaspirillum sp. L7-7A]